MKKSYAVLALMLTLGACSQGSLPTTDPLPTFEAPSTPTATVNAPQPITPPKSVEVVFYRNAGFYVKGGEGGVVYAYITSFDDQRTAIAVKKGKDSRFEGTFDKTCVQLDITGEQTFVGSVGGRPFAYAYFGKNGKELGPSEYAAGISECRIQPPPPPRDPDPQPTPTPTPTPSPTPTPGLCYYRVSCGQSAHETHCTDRDQQELCEAAIVFGGTDHGVWLNFGEQALQNHCRFNEPGVSKLNFQLNPGQSAKGCLSKHDIE